MTKAMPRCVRNNNPLNVRYGQNWQGELAASKMTPAQLAERRLEKEGRPGFEVFESPVYGFRAAAIILRNYQRLYGLNTVWDMIHRFAPPGDNNKSAVYAEFVAKRMGIGVKEPFDFTDHAHAFAMLRAMAIKECGDWYFTDADINAALNMIGIHPENRPLTKTRTAVGAQVATAGVAATALAEVADIVDATAPAFPLIQTVLSTAPFVALALILVGVGYMVWARIDDRRAGLR